MKQDTFKKIGAGLLIGAAVGGGSMLLVDNKKVDKDIVDKILELEEKKRENFAKMSERLGADTQEEITIRLEKEAIAQEKFREFIRNNQ